MKTTNSILFLLFFFYFDANSQLAINFSSLKHLQLKAGLEAGMNISSIQLRNVFSDGGEFKPVNKIGLKVGLNILYRINYYFDIESGIFYKNLGQELRSKNVDLPDYITDDENSYTSNPVIWNGSSNPGGFTFVSDPGDYYYFPETNMSELYDLKYLNIPLKLKYKIKKISISAGLYGSLLLDGKYKRTITKVEVPTNNILSSKTYNEKVTINSSKVVKTPNLQKTYSSYDYGVSFGIGYQFQKFIIKAEYEHALKNAIEYKTTSYYFWSNYVDEKFKNRSFSISMVYCLYK